MAQQAARQPTKQYFVTAAAGIFIGAALFDVLPKIMHEHFGLGLMASGALLWFILKMLTDLVARSGLAVVSAFAFWLHSFLEGAVTALSFAANFTIGIAVAIGMLLHLVPEFFAITSLLRGEGVSVRHSVWTDLIGVAILFAAFVALSIWLPNLSEALLKSAMALSGGAFLYIGVASFMKREKSMANIVGLAVGLVVVGAWSLVG